MFTDDLIKHLIECPKSITSPPKSAGSNRGSSKRFFHLQSDEGATHLFKAFITQNLTFQENFSIGLTYCPPLERDRIVLLRVNGPHGPTFTHPHHLYCHIHLSTAERINAGLKPEGHIEIASEYSTFSDAIQYFIKRINLDPLDRRKYFPPPDNQYDLFSNLQSE